MLHSITTRERLSYMGIVTDSIMCRICSICVEAIDHLFTGCGELLDIWSRVAVWWSVQLPNSFTVQMLFSWSDSDRLTSSQCKALHAIVMTVVWCI